MSIIAVRSFRARTPRNLNRVSPQIHGSSIFPTKNLSFKTGNGEVVVLGGKANYPLVAQAFEKAGIKQILFIGWGSQGPAQAQNLRDTLQNTGSDIKVCVGLRPGSKSLQAAREAGFFEVDGTLGDPYALASKSDLIICLVADGGMVEIYQNILAAAKPGAIIGISHGFIAAHLETLGQTLPLDHDLIMVAPKGMGPSVRDLYVQGLQVDGAGINSSVAVHTNDPQRYDLVRDVANAWSVGIGSPVTFGTSFLSEVTSDLFGERAILLGALWGITESLFKYFTVIRKDETTAYDAFKLAVTGLTGTVTKKLSALGIKGFYESLTEEQKGHFDRGYAIGYPVCDEVHGKVYDSVSSLAEIADVVTATKKLTREKMGSVEATHQMWAYAKQGEWYGPKKDVPMCNDLAFTAGVYIGAMMAQLHTLMHHGHPVSEFINESLVEAIDSLTPFMHILGVAHMVHNCSTTAQLGTLKWGPVYRKALDKVLEDPTLQLSDADLKTVLQTLHDDDLHQDISVCFALRPAVKIAVDPLRKKAA